MKVAVFDHINGSVDIIDTNVKPDHDFDWELWLSDHDHPSNCSWMIDAKQIVFKEDRHNYH